VFCITHAAPEAGHAARCCVLLQLDVGVKVTTKLGQDVVLVGSHATMGSWSIDDALPLQWTDGHVWRASVELPPDCAEVEYKVRPRCQTGRSTPLALPLCGQARNHAGIESH
jgi:hypothetical protein